MFGSLGRFGNGANVGWNSASGISAGVTLALGGGNSIGVNANRQGTSLTGSVQGTNLFTSSSNGSFQINTNFANERLTNNAVNEAQDAFDAKQNAKLKEGEDKSLKEAGFNPNLEGEERKAALKKVVLMRENDRLRAEGIDPDNLTEKEREDTLGRLDDPNNRGRGTSRNGYLSNLVGDFKDGFTSLGTALGLGGNQVSGASGFVDERGVFHPRTCFTKGTLVKTIDGFKVIEEIKAGDIVYSWDEETNSYSYKKVVNTFTRQADKIYTLTYIDGTKLETTWNHPFWIVSKDGSHGDWVQAKDLKSGDLSFTANGQTLLLASIKVEDREETVYNFEVEDNHTYFVGESEVLVHNDGCMPVFDSIVAQEIKNVADVLEKTETVQASIQYAEGTLESVVEKVDFGKAVAQCDGKCAKQLASAAIEELGKPPMKILGQEVNLGTAANTYINSVLLPVTVGVSIIKGVSEQAIDATGLGGKGFRGAGKAHTDILTDIALGVVGSKGVKILSNVGQVGVKGIKETSKISREVIKEATDLNKGLKNLADKAVKDGTELYGNNKPNKLKQITSSGLSEQEHLKQMPKEFIDAVQKTGKSIQDIHGEYKLYNRKTAGFFEDITSYLSKNNKHGLTNSEAYALWDFTTPHTFQNLNKYLRQYPDPGKYTDLVNLIDKGLDKMPTYKGEGYRGITLRGKALDDFIKTHQKGSIVKSGAYESYASTNEGSYAIKDNKNIKITTIFNGKNAKVISYLSDGIRYNNMQPEEILLKRNVEKKVIEFKKEGGKYLLIEEEL